MTSHTSIPHAEAQQLQLINQRYVSRSDIYSQAASSFPLRQEWETGTVRRKENSLIERAGKARVALAAQPADNFRNIAPCNGVYWLDLRVQARKAT